MPDGSTYVSPEVERFVYNGPVYSNPIAKTVPGEPSTGNEAPLTQKSMPIV